MFNLVAVFDDLSYDASARIDNSRQDLLAFWHSSVELFCILFLVAHCMVPTFVLTSTGTLTRRLTDYIVLYVRHTVHYLENTLHNIFSSPR